MPSRIPLRIADRDFRSNNQARIHYRDILHRYQPGDDLNQEDGQQVFELLASSSLPLPSQRALGVRVVQGNYGRRCFASLVSEKDVRMVSIMRAVKSCATAPCVEPSEKMGIQGKQNTSPKSGD